MQSIVKQKSYLTKIQPDDRGVYAVMEGKNQNSCLYRAKVSHHRLSPKKHSFYYDIFMFYLDLDELDALSKKLWLMSRNRFNLFNFRDGDHLQLPRHDPDKTRNIRAHLKTYLKEQGVEIGKGKIMILTNLCTMGYQFNPVSFYYCYQENGQPLCAVAEVGNTFQEMKPYFLGTDTLHKKSFQMNATKNFYVSPFIDLDTHFDFKLDIPEDSLNVRIDDYDQNGKLFFMSSLKGRRVPLNDRNLLKYFFTFPFITLKITILIHWQAILLWWKKIGFSRKSENLILQKEVYRPYKY